MTAAALEVEFNCILTNLLEKDHLSDEFLAINPQHIVPTLVDGDFTLWESRAICIYLIEKYGGDENSLYPDEIEVRALINQRMYFDIGTLFPSFRDYYMAPIQGHEKTPENFEKCQKAMALLNGFLEKSRYVAGTEEITVADLVLFASVSTFEIAGFDFTDYPKVKEWLDILKESAPGRVTNEEGLVMMKKFLGVDEGVEEGEGEEVEIEK